VSTVEKSFKVELTIQLNPGTSILQRLMRPAVGAFPASGLYNEQVVGELGRLDVIGRASWFS
jgi:hypothetical protein